MADPGDNVNGDLVTYAEAARRLVTEGIRPHMTRQAVRRLHRVDPEFPGPVFRAVSAKRADTTHLVLFEWSQLRTYFLEQDFTPGRHKGLHDGLSARVP